MTYPGLVPGEGTDLDAPVSPLLGEDPNYAQPSTLEGEDQRETEKDNLWRAIFQNESSSGADLRTSSAGAVGPAQIIPSTWRQYAEPGEDINDFNDNIRVGQRIVSDLYDKYGGDKNAVLIGYNAGEGRIGLPFGRLPQETQNYLIKAHQFMGSPDPIRMAQAAPNLNFSDVDTRTATGAERPLPEVSPVISPKSIPRLIGPFQSEYDAYAATPRDRDSYVLQDGPNGSFYWQPKTSLGTALQANPTANPQFNPGEAEKIVNQSIVNSPHSWSNPISSFVGTMGQGFNGQLAGLLDLPAWVADRGLDAIAAGTGTQRMPIHFGTPIRNLMNSLGFDTERARIPDTDSNKWAADMGYGIGSGIGMVMPVLAGGAAGAALEASGAGGNAATIARQASGLGKGMEGFLPEVSIGGAGGLGQEEAHEVYKSATGREGDLGDILSQLVGGSAWNAARVPFVAAAETSAGQAFKAGATSFKRAWEGAKAGKADIYGADQLEQPMDSVTGQKVANGVLARQLIDNRNEAEQHVAALGGKDPQDAATYIADRSAAGRAAVEHWLGRTSEAEDQLLQSVNPDLPRDFTSTKGLYAQMRQDYQAAGPHAVNDWPKELDSFFRQDVQPGPSRFGQLLPQELQAQTPEVSGKLSNIDSFGSGWTVYKDLNRLIERSMKTGGIPINEARLGFLQKVRNQLGKDLEGPEGATLPEIDAMRQLRTFNAGRQQILESPEMKDFLSASLPDGKAIDKLLKQGPEGADAVKILVGAAQSKFGPDGLLSAAQDVLRQKYANAVAPNGYISQNAHQNFMNRYAGILDHPTMMDLRTQFNQAASSEANLNATVGFGKPGGFGNTSGQIEKRADAFETYMNAPVETIMRHLEGVQSKDIATRRVIDRLQSADDSGAALKGFMHVVAARALDGGPEYVANNQDIFNAISRVNPGFLERTEKYLDPTTKQGMAKALGDWGLSYLGARFGSALSEGLNMGGGMVMAGRGAAFARMAGQKVRDQLTKISSANIVDSEADAAWGRITSGIPSSLAQLARDKLLLHAYVPGMAIGNLPTKEGQPGDPGVPMQPTHKWWLDPMVFPQAPGQ